VPADEAVGAGDEGLLKQACGRQRCRAAPANCCAGP
jgi:hypothetical protein